MDVVAAATWFGDEISDLGDLLGIVARSRPAWQADAACREHPEVDFFPGPGRDVGPALEVCASCLVLDECARWACKQGPDLHGIWGGLSPTGRNRLDRAGGYRADPVAVRAEQDRALDASRQPRPAADWDPGPITPRAPLPARRSEREECAGCGQASRWLTAGLCAVCVYNARYTDAEAPVLS